MRMDARQTQKVAAMPGGGPPWRLRRMLRLFLLAAALAAPASAWEAAVFVDAGSTGSRAHLVRWDRRPQLAVKLGPSASWKLRPGIAAVEAGAAAGAPPAHAAAGAAGGATAQSAVRAAAPAAVPAGAAATAGAAGGTAVSSQKHLANPAGSAASPPPLREYLARLRAGIRSLLREHGVAETAKVPLRILGTGGIRALSPERREALVVKVSGEIATWIEFSDASFRILTGVDEAIYAWLALAQLYHLDQVRLEKKGVWFEELAPVPLSALSLKTPALIELGGASVQVVFRAPASAAAPATDGRLDEQIQDASRVSLAVGGETIALYAHSFEGFGRQTALQSFLRAADAEQLIPCLPANMLFPVGSEGSDAVDENIGRVVGDGTEAPVDHRRGSHLSDFAHCRRRIRELLFGHVGEGGGGVAGGEGEVVAGGGDTVAGGGGEALAAVGSIPAPSASASAGVPFGASSAAASAGGSSESVEDEAKTSASRDVQSLKHALGRAVLPRDAEIIGTENFYYMYGMVLDPARASGKRMTVAALRRRAWELCALRSTEEILPQLHERAEFEKAATGCFGLTYIAEFLEQMLGFDEEREMHVEHRVMGVEVGWVFGYALAELSEVASRGRAGAAGHDEL